MKSISWGTYIYFHLKFVLYDLSSCTFGKLDDK